MNLNEAVALVAGASGGIGRAIAFGLLGAGAEVFMLGRRIFRREAGWMSSFLSSGTYERSDELAAFVRQIAANVVGPYSLIQMKAVADTRSPRAKIDRRIQ